MQDRLGDLIGTHQANDIAIHIEDEAKTFVRPKFMEEFFRKVETVQSDITNIQFAINKIGELNQKSVTSTSSNEEQAISQELQNIIDNTNKYAANAKSTLEILKKQSIEKKTNKESIASEIRIRDNMYAALTRKFMDAMKDYQKCQQKYKTDIKNKVRRQVQIVKPEATEEEIDIVMKSGDPGAVYKSAILQGTSDPIRDVYMNCQDKYQDIIRLEQSVTELHQMFLDLALLVEQQGELLDNIETQVQSASDYIEAGNVEVEKAIKHQACARKKKCILLFIGLVIIGIIVLGFKII